MNQNQNNFSQFPGVDVLIRTPELQTAISQYGKELVTYSIRQLVEAFKNSSRQGEAIPSIQFIISAVEKRLQILSQKHLRNVINATGIVMHTNLGRAPFSQEMIDDAKVVLKGYNNLEFDLETAKRGSRHSHIAEILKYLTGAEDVLVVNNNAAAVMLTLGEFSKNKEVIVSRGELIEIGGSFRLPDILAQSGCIMVEVGATNKTRIQDYENAISENTGVLLKAHTSNYTIQGFTEEVSLKDMVKLGRKYHVPVFYDMGSGLLQELPLKALKDEPDVRRTLAMGVDLVCFSGDKLLGGPQAGIIAGKAELIARLKENPLVRALRVGKLTLAFLESACMQYLNHDRLFKNNMIYNILSQQPEKIKERAHELQRKLSEFQIATQVYPSKGQFGGGSLPGESLDSYEVKIEISSASKRQKSISSEKLYKGLLDHKSPVLSILKKGEVHLDLLSINDDEISKIALIINDVYKTIGI
ncbi:MAG: L-seryl-tRNA(Sec) selenium transferase [Bacteroidales bacterium]|nr:L-seryl-tRNA(Sec) selenium transferase [Bacteroidales bacterium]